jgi:hypothetical protein
MCGECLVRPVRALFAAHLHHGGYLRAAEAIAGRLLDLYQESEGEGGEMVGEKKTSTGSTVIESEIQSNSSTSATSSGSSSSSSGSSGSASTNTAYLAATQIKPPDFLISAWQHAMKLRASTRTFFLSQPVPKPAPTPSAPSSASSVDQSSILTDSKDESKGESKVEINTAPVRTRTTQVALTIEEISDRIYGRILFLLQVEACSCDRLVEYTVEGDLGSGPLSSTKDAFTANQTSLHDFETVMGSNLSFIIDPRTSIPHIRAVLDNVQGTSFYVVLRVEYFCFL